MTTGSKKSYLAVIASVMLILLTNCSKNYQIPRTNTIPTDSLQTYSVDEVNEKPKPMGGYRKLLSELDYPFRARQNGIKGTVVIRVLVTKSGNGIGSYIEKSPDPLLSEPALELIQNTTFHPGKIGRIPVNTWISIPFHFQMAKKSDLQSNSR